MILPLSLAILSVGCARNYGIATDWQCYDQIKLAEKHFSQHETAIDQSEQSVISGLIKTARIQREHAQFTECVDTSHRALSLMGYRADEETEAKNHQK